MSCILKNWFLVDTACLICLQGQEQVQGQQPECWGAAVVKAAALLGEGCCCCCHCCSRGNMMAWIVLHIHSSGMIIRVVLKYSEVKGSSQDVSLCRWCSNVCYRPLHWRSASPARDHHRPVKTFILVQKCIYHKLSKDADWSELTWKEQTSPIRHTAISMTFMVPLWRLIKNDSWFVCRTFKQ